MNVTVTSPTEILVQWERPETIYKRIDKYVIRIRSVSGEVLEEKESYGDNTEVFYHLYLLSCKPRMTVTSRFVYKVSRDLELIVQVIYQFAFAQVECASKCFTKQL